MVYDEEERLKRRMRKLIIGDKKESFHKFFRIHHISLQTLFCQSHRCCVGHFCLLFDYCCHFGDFPDMNKKQNRQFSDTSNFGLGLNNVSVILAAQITHS